jgi:TolB protein
MIYYLSFYDQFARSHRLWSPDSLSLVYGEMLDDGSSVVSLLDTTRPGSAPQHIARGSLGIFNW